jgi:hypothetical protein
MYPRNLADSKKYFIQLKERYGYDNVREILVDIPTSEVDWIKMHLATPIENLRNGLEITLDEEDYETAAMITKIIQWLESDENEIVFELKNTENYKQLKVSKKREENS